VRFGNSFRVAAIGVATALVASCFNLGSNVNPYPPEWSPIAHDRTASECPNIAGTYDDFGSEGRSTAYGPTRTCQLHKEYACNSLAYNLESHYFGTSQFFREVYGGKTPHEDVAPMVRIVKIRQPDNNVIEITIDAWDSNLPPPAPRQLSKLHGDFSCDRSGILIRGDTEAVFVLIGDVLETEFRTFYRANDEFLVMLVKNSLVGHYTFLPIAESREGWVRWKRHESDHLNQDGSSSKSPGSNEPVTPR